MLNSFLCSLIAYPRTQWMFWDKSVTCTLSCGMLEIFLGSRISMAAAFCLWASRYFSVVKSGTFMMTQRRVSTGSSAERASATTMAPRQPHHPKKWHGKNENLKRSQDKINFITVKMIIQMCLACGVSVICINTENPTFFSHWSNLNKQMWQYPRLFGGSSNTKLIIQSLVSRLYIFKWRPKA